MALDQSDIEWLNGKIRHEVEQEVAALRTQVAEQAEKIERLDDWINGVQAALRDLLIPLLKTHPEVAQVLEPQWSRASQRYEALQTEMGQSPDFHETEEMLEARKMLYRTLRTMRAWPGTPPD